MLFSWLRRRGDPPSTVVRINPMPPSGHDWSAFERSEGWPSIKVWFATETLSRLDEVARYRDQSRSEVIRDLLFIALYGHYTYAQLLAERRGMPRAPGELVSGESVAFSRKRMESDEAPAPTVPPPAPREPMRENLRLFVPEPMKLALEAMARRDGATVSATTRALVERMLLGAMPLAPAHREPPG